VEISHLPAPHLRADWPIIEAMLAPATETDTFNPEIDVCWLAYEGGTALGAATTRLQTDGIAVLRLAGGHEFRRWIGLLDEAVTDWARACGATALRMWGRKGWVRFARTFGWVPQHQEDDGKWLFTKDIG
jgi:hypothetical protein